MCRYLDVKLCLLFVFGVLVSGCSTLSDTSDYIAQADTDRRNITSWAEVDDGKDATYLNQLLASPALDQLIAEARAANPDLQQTLLSLEILRAQYRATRADALPDIDAGFGTSKTEDADTTYSGSVTVSSLSSVQQAVDRERRFLRHASHELRTPISTIRSNIELQRKLAHKREKPADEQNIVDRIDRASLTMKHLTETLLWLNHEPDAPLQSETVDLPELIRELATEMEYLLAGKPVTTDIFTFPYSCTVPLVPARIILGNLIRNAYQHCWEGTVVIEQRDNRITITNPAEQDAQNVSTKTSETGYGLGLELTTTLSQRIGWHYTSGRHENVHRVVVEIGTAVSS